MKITRIEVFQFRSDEKINFKPVGCRIYTDEGLYGDGEAALSYGVAKTAAVGMIRDLAQLVIGMNPLDNEIIWDKLHKSTFWGQNGGPVIFAGMSAIDMALWDIKGKYFNAPLYCLLGGKRNVKLRTYASQIQVGWGDLARPMVTPQDYAEAAKICIKEGYDALKADFLSFDGAGNKIPYEKCMCKLKSELLNMALDRLAAVRDAVGPAVDIIIENHSNLDALSAIQYALAAEKFNILYFEEPNTPSPKTLKYISENINIPIANGERIYSRWQYAPYFEDMSIQIAQPDLGTCGGVTEGKKICDMAHTYDIAVQLHACGSPMSSTAALHLESVIPNFIIHEHHFCFTRRSNIELCINDYQPKNGQFDIPERPGIGNEWSEKAIAESERFIIEAN